MKKNSYCILILYFLFVSFDVFSINVFDQDRKKFFSFDENIINGTTGTPLGGFGCGGIKFNANTGTFAVMTAPPADAYDFMEKKGTCFQLYTERNGKIETRKILTASKTNDRPNDDAIWPLHFVDFGCINGIQISLTGISPLDNQNYENMHLPYALYEISLTNTGDTDATTSFAFQWNDDKTPFINLPKKGFYNDEWCILVKSNIGKAKISIGDDTDNHFLSDGECSLSDTSSPTRKIAVKATLNAHETQKIHFVLAWYNRTDPEIAFYKNKYQNPKGIAEHGMKVFSSLKNNAEKLVNGIRESNLPDWLKNQALNTLVNIVTNSMYKKDGRVAFAEGQWTCFGTMDQMWLSRQIINMLIPYYAWQELHYWARTQMNNGQIHHDFNIMNVKDKRERSALVSWDDTEHADYRNIQKWVDLNCGFIISVFEIYQATGDQKQFDKLWPYVKKAAQRILDQVEKYGSKKYPYTFDGSENSYDAGGNPDPYNANISAVAYKIMTILAQEKGESEIIKQYDYAYKTVVNSFHNRYIKDGLFTTGKHCESVFAGQWLSQHLKLGEIWPAEDTDTILNILENYYYPYYLGLGYPQGTYDEWTPYILTHYGGLLLQTGRLKQWLVMQKDAYLRQYLNRERVFDHALNILPSIEQPKWISTNIKSKKQYISIPSIWRNYYDIIGFHRDARTQKLWIEPILLPGTDELKNAMFISPESWGYISYNRKDNNDTRNIEISVKTEKKMRVSTLYLTDHFTGDITVTIDGKKYPYTRTGSGYAKKIAVEWNGTITHKGIEIKLSGAPKHIHIPCPIKPDKEVLPLVLPNKMSPYEIMEAINADKLIGTSIDSTSAGAYVTGCNNFDYIQFSNIDFGKKGATSIRLNILSTSENSGVEIVIDDTSGKIVGNCPIPNAENGQTWVDVECPIEKITGMHNIILRFYGGQDGNLMNIKHIQFKI